MAITKKPKGSQAASRSKGDEQAVQAFIAGAGKPNQEATKKPVMIRFAPELLARVDAAAKRRGISRSAWVLYTVSRALDQDEA